MFLKFYYLKTMSQNHQTNNQKMSKHFYTSEEIDFMRDNAKGISVQELTNRFNDKFGTNISKTAIARIKSNYGIKSDYNSGKFTSERLKGNKFRAGIKPINGFKTGNSPHTTRPLGSERINKDGYVEIKTSYPKKWKLKHHVIYEKAYNYKLKPGEKIIFLDRNKRNFKVNNLIKITTRQQVILARSSIKSNIPEINLAEINLARYREKIIQINKKLSKSGDINATD